MHKIIRITTISKSLKILLGGQLKYMQKYYEIIGIAAGNEVLQKVAEDEGIRVIPVEMTRSITPLKDLVSLIRLCKVLKKEKPDIVHSHTPKAGILGMLAAKLCKVPVRMHTVAGLPLLESKGFKKVILDRVEMITYKCATNVYPNSYGLENIILKNRYCNKSKLKVIGNGSSNGVDSIYFSRDAVNDVELDSIRKINNLKTEDNVFIYIGRLVKDKGINELVEAFDALYNKNSEVKLLLLGIQERELDPLNTITLNILANHPAIKLIGWKSDVRPYLATSHVLILPSYREGLPNVPLQACSMGIPCIVTNVNGSNEIIHDEYNGLVIPLKDANALQIAMQRMILEKELYNKMKLNARKSVIAKYDQKFLWRKIKEEYDFQLT